MALVVRYRQGTRVDVDADPFEDLTHFLSRRGEPGFPLGPLEGLIRREIWDQWPRPDARSTWFALLQEFFRIHGDQVRERIWQAQLRLLDALVPGGAAEDVWSRVLAVVLQDLDELTGWEFSTARMSAIRWPVERAQDGTYYREEDGERIQVIGARTLIETRLEYITDDCLRRYGCVGQMCRLVALFCLHSDFQRYADRYPESVRAVLPEDSYLQWGWHHLNPFRSSRVPWRPPDRHSDPDVLAIDVIAWYSQRNPLPVAAQVTEQRVPHQDFTRQYELAVDTDLRLGDEDEALIVYRDRDIRWLNGTRAVCPVVIVGVHDNHPVAEMQLVEEFLSILCFNTQIPLAPVTSVIGPRKAAPTVVQPRKLGDHIYPASLRLDNGRLLSPERCLALALYRDGISSQSSYYQFLSLYKILQIRLPGPSVADWINAHADDNIPSITWIRELRAEGVTNLAEYLYENWRNAIAHVEREPRVNPDDLEQRMRINQDLPIVRDMARTMIESELLD